MAKRQFQENDIMQSAKRFRKDGNGAEISILVMDRDIGRVIGKGGETVKNIRKESGANIDIPKAVNAYDRVIFVKGSVTEISKAIQMIVTIASEDNPMISILAEQRSIGALIGKQGANIKQIREDTQANIHIGNECLGNSTQIQIKISGDAEAVSKAIELVVTDVADGTNLVRVPYIPSGVGNLGNHSLNSSGVGGMYHASQVMPLQNQIVESTPSFFKIETTITVPKKLIGKIIGRGGNNINTVRRQSGAQINISTREEDADSTESKITITGQRKSIELACSMLESLARSLGSPENSGNVN